MWGTACKQNQSIPNKPLTDLAEILPLKAAQLQRGYPVKLRASVVYRDGDNLYVAQDMAGGIAIDPGWTGDDVTPGDVIDIEGRTGTGIAAPVLREARIRWVMRLMPPRARPAVAKDVLAGKDEHQWVEVHGILKAIHPAGKLLDLDIASGSAVLHALTGYRQDIDPSLLKGKSVSVRGVAVGRYSSSGQPLETRLYMAQTFGALVEASRLERLHPLALPFLWSPPNRLRCCRLITCLSSSSACAESSRFTISNSTSSTCRIRLAGIFVFPADDMRDSYQNKEVEILGFSAPGGFAPTIRAKSVRVIGDGHMPEPARLEAARGLHIEVRLEILARRVDLQRLAIDRVLRGGEVGVLRLGGGEDFFEGHLKRAFP